MKSQIETLKREIDIHKEVEKELAKRSHFCQKVIKRLRSEIKEFEDANSKTQNQASIHSPQRIGSKTMREKNNNNVYLSDELKSAEELVQFLEGKLEAHEKNLVLRQNEYEQLQNEY